MTAVAYIPAKKRRYITRRIRRLARVYASGSTGRALATAGAGRAGRMPRRPRRGGGIDSIPKRRGGGRSRRRAARLHIATGVAQHGPVRREVETARSQTFALAAAQGGAGGGGRRAAHGVGRRRVQAALAAAGGACRRMCTCASDTSSGPMPSAAPRRMPPGPGMADLSHARPMPRCRPDCGI